jgi:hypothetical protein
VLEAYYLLPFNVRSGMCGTYFHTPTFLWKFILRQRDKVTK